MNIIKQLFMKPTLMGPAAARKKFLRFFSKGFNDPTYLHWERNYKWEAHQRWQKHLNPEAFKQLLTDGAYSDIARHAVQVESKTNLLFSFEKMALRDAVRTEDGAKIFAEGLFAYIYGKEPLQQRFEQFTDALAALPRRQTRVLTWPLQTVFGFLAKPEEHIFLKPRVTQMAAHKYDFPFRYTSRPNWDTYQNLLDFADRIQQDNDDLKPQDYIDLQSFIWVLGSSEYD